MESLKAQNRIGGLTAAERGSLAGSRASASKGRLLGRFFGASCDRSRRAANNFGGALSREPGRLCRDDTALQAHR